MILLALYSAYRWFRTTKEQYVASDTEDKKTILESISVVLNNIKDRSSSVISDSVGVDDDEAINNSA
jgi:hypothetical protein